MKSVCPNSSKHNEMDFRTCLLFIFINFPCVFQKSMFSRMVLFRVLHLSIHELQRFDFVLKIYVLKIVFAHLAHQ